MGYASIVGERVSALAKSGHARILAIETSCDETAAAVVADGRMILSNIIASQVDTHAPYGGVVPEIASRQHVESIDYIVKQALLSANTRLDELDAVAVTYGPGLVGALLVGVTFAKALAYAAGLPLIAVHHIEGHICANYVADPALAPPYVCLIASGGHSHIVDVGGYGQYRLLGQTQDDAAGEAFDKAARVLGLPYPGGPKLDELAENGNPTAVSLPRARTQGRYDVSFSGVKTALINRVHASRQRGAEIAAADIAASFRMAVVEPLVQKTMLAAQDLHANTIVLAGGVAANRLLRRMMKEAAEAAGMRCQMPPAELCTDNAAMIGSAAFFRLMRKETAGLTLNAVPTVALF